MEKKRVCVIGAGIIGLSVATHLLEEYQNSLDVTVVADKFSPDTAASDRTGGLFIPPRTHFPCPDLSTAKRWVSGSLRRFERLVAELGEERVGIKRSEGYYFPLDSETLWWSELIPDFHRVVDGDSLFPHMQRTDVYSYTSYLVNGTVYLQWLLHRFRSLGGNVSKQFVNSLFELSQYDCLVNCSGLGARELANDADVYPSKGHLVLVKAPWVKKWVHSVAAYIYTRIDGVVLGTTAEPGKEDLQVSDICKQVILDNCRNVLPSLSEADIDMCWAGVRPMRTNGVRLETEHYPYHHYSAKGSSNHSNGVDTGQLVVHCYGHGSYGVTLSWGCAKDVGDIVGRCLKVLSKI